MEDYLWIQLRDVMLFSTFRTLGQTRIISKTKSNGKTLGTGVVPIEGSPMLKLA